MEQDSLLGYKERRGDGCSFCRLSISSLWKEILCEGETLGGESTVLLLVLFVLLNENLYFFFSFFQFLAPDSSSIHRIRVRGRPRKLQVKPLEVYW